MPDNISTDVIKLETADNSPVILPNGTSAANAQFTRDGMDLYLNSPGGHTIKVEGYFAHDPAPDLVSADGGRLSPQLVESFLPPQHPGEVAANTGTTATDAGSVGKVTEVTGDATVTHPDGSHVKIEVGTSVHMGDVIQTSAKGAVHILFADNTTFAISESARLSIDNYTYNADDHSGTSFFSLLHGAFVYTSGLIGKSDPGNVNIETPVGSIGIRGTVVAGDINDAGQPSTITIVDGAIVVTNGGGSVQLSSAFDTATLTGYSTAPTDSGVMSAQSFNDAYSAVAPADPGFYSLTGTAPTTTTAPATTSPDTTTTPDTTTSPTTTAPDGMTQVSPDQTVAPATTTTEASATTDTTVVATTDPYDPTVTDTSVALNDPTLTTPPSTTTFTSTTDTTTFGTISPSSGGTTGGTSFTSTSTTGTTTISGSTSTTGISATGSTVSSTGGSTTSTATVSNPPPLTAQFMFSDPYLNGTPGKTGDDGIPLFGPLLANDIMKTTWGTTVQIGSVSVTPPPGTTFVPTSYTLTGSHVVASGTGWDIIGNKLAYDTTTTTTDGDTTVVTGVPIMHVDISSAGVMSLSFVGTGITDTLGVIPYIQQAGTFDFKITASDGTNVATTQQFGFQFQPLGPMSANPIIDIGDEQGAGYINNFIVGGDAILWGKGGDDGLTSSGGNVFMFGDTGNDTLLSYGGNVVQYGGIGDDQLSWVFTGGGTIKMFGGDGNDFMTINNPSPLTDSVSIIDGGLGTNTLQVGQFAGSSQTYNFEGLKNVTNIDTLVIAGTLGNNNTVRLDFQDIFDMNASHTLNINNLNTGYGTSVIIDSLGETTGPAAVSIATVGLDTIKTITATLVSNSATVTLIINQGNALPTDGVSVTVN